MSMGPHCVSRYGACLYGIHYGLFFLPVLVMLLVVPLSVIAHDPAFPRGGCPPIEEETVDLQMLGEMLADTKAIGLVSKIGLKKDINKLLKKFKKYHDGKSTYTLEQLEEQYDLLLMKIAVYLQDSDISLHQQLCNAWLPIWQDLMNYDRFHEHHL